MQTGLLKVQLNLNGVGSLKDKRKIVKSLIERLKSRFNVSVSEIGHNDSKITAMIGVAVISNDGKFVNTQLDKIIDFIRNDGRFYLGPIEREMFGF